MLFLAFGGFTSSWFVTNFGLRDPAVAIFLLGGLCYIAMGLSNSIALIGLMRFMQGFFSEIFIKKIYFHFYLKVTAQDFHQVYLLYIILKFLDQPVLSMALSLIAFCSWEF